MGTCGQCGTQLPDAASFCSNCGRPLKPGSTTARVGKAEIYLAIAVALLAFLIYLGAGYLLHNVVDWRSWAISGIIVSAALALVLYLCVAYRQAMGRGQVFFIFGLSLVAALGIPEGVEHAAATIRVLVLGVGSASFALGLLWGYRAANRSERVPPPK